MLKVASAALLAVGLVALPHAAADAEQAKAPAYAAYNWTGFYIGGTVGGARSTNKVRANTVDGPLPAQFQEDGPAVSAFGSNDISQTNVIFGGKVGFNQQLRGNWLVGIEADVSSLRFNQSITKTGNPFVTYPFGFATFNTSVSTDWVATVRPRIGYAFDRALIYVTGGVAFGNESFTNTYADQANHGFGFGSASSAASAVKAGWTAGAGIDYALSRNWIASVEYLHIDLGSIHASGIVTDSGGPINSSLNFSSRLQSDIVRVGLAYKFGGSNVADY